MLTLSLSKALLCAAAQCWNVLIGPGTPTGEFMLIQRFTEDAGYGGDVLQFHEDAKYVYAIHRVWTLRPKEKRVERLKSNNPNLRSITHGCVNVDPAVYDHLVRTFPNATLRIEP